MSLSRRLSVGSLLNAILLLLSLGLAATLLVSMLSAWQDLSEARRVSALALANRTVFQATQDTRLNRANVQTALLGQVDPRPRLAELRQAFADAVDQTLAAVDLAVVPEGDALARKVREAANGLVAAWPALDALALRPAPQRAATLYVETPYKAWYQAASGLVEAWDKLAHASLGASRIADPVIGELAGVQQYAWAMRELSGNECQLMRAYVIAGKLLPADARSRLDGMRGAGEASWEGLDSLLKRPGAAADLVAIAAAGKATWNQNNAERDAVYRRLEAGTATPADGFGTMCTAPFGSFLAVINKAFDLMEAEATDRRTQARRRLALTAVALAIVLLVGTVIRREVRRRVIRPVRELTAAIDALRDRDFTRPVPQVGRHDEFATMAQTLEALRLGAREAEAMAAERASAQEAALQRAAGVSLLCRDFEAVVVTTLETVGAATSKMTGSAEDMMATSRSALAEADDVAAAVQQTAGNIDKVAGAVVEMKSSNSEIAKKVAESTRIAGQAVSDAELSNRDVSRLSQAANEIGAVVKLIGDIAAQTNLLALNATIEAARAGDAGKGFAVVASEVKSLATQTAKATEDITAQVAAMQGATRSAVDAIGDIGVRIRELDQIATLIAGAVEEQDSAMRQIARDAGEVAEVTAHVSSRLGNLRDAAQRTGTAAATVRDNSGSLTSQADTLSNQVVDFIEKLGQA